MSQRKIPSACLAFPAVVALLLLAGQASALENVALGKPATQSSEYGGYPASNAVDGNFGNFTHTATADAAAWWEVNLNETDSISYIRISNRGDGCCQSRLRDITVTILDSPTDLGGSALWTSELLNPEGILATPLATGPKTIVLDLVALTGAPVDGGAIRITRIADPDLSGNKELAPNEADKTVLSFGELEVFTGICGDATGNCDGIAVEGPLNAGPGVYTVTASSPDATAYYHFTFSNGKDPDIVIGPQAESIATQVLTAGTWQVSVNVSSDALCPATNPESTREQDVTVQDCSEDPKDTHCQGLTVDPPPGGFFPGLYTATAGGTDDSSDPVAYSFSASNGIDPPLTKLPSISEVTLFDLGVGTWTIEAALGDSLYCPPDGAGDSVCTEIVTVKQLSANPNIAMRGIAAQSTEWNGGVSFPASLAINGDFGDFTHTANNDIDPNTFEFNPAWWQVALDDVWAIDAVKIFNRTSCCASRLRDITVSILDADGVEVWTTQELLNPENIFGGGIEQIGPPSLTLSLIDLAGAPVNGSAVRIVRTPDPDNSGASFNPASTDEMSVLSLGEVEIYGALAQLPANVVRDIGADSITNGVFTASAKETEVPVTISVEAKAPNTAVKVVEVLPAGASAAGITEGGQLTADTIVWDFPAVTSKSLAYRLVLGNSCSLTLDFLGDSFVAAGQKGRIRGDRSLAREIIDGPLGTWTSEDIGTTGGAALASGAHDLMIEATGAGVGSGLDAFHFIHQPATGDFDVSFRLDCWSGTGQPQAGLMVRASTAENSSMLFFSLVPPAGASASAGNLVITWRKKTGNTALPAAVITGKVVDSLPIHLKLARKGAVLVASRSPDGVAWTDLSVRIGTATVTEIPIGSSTNQVDLGAETVFGIGAGAWGVGSARFALGAVSGPEFTTGEQLQPPAGVTAAGGSKQVALSWSPPAAGPAPTGYEVFRGAAKIADVAATPAAYTDSDPALVVGTEYCYTVKSKAGAATSAASNQACGTPFEAGAANFKRGDLNDDGGQDISDAVYLLAYLYVGGPAPKCLDAGHLNSDAGVDISDAVYLLSFLYVGGPAPPYAGYPACEEFPSCPKSSKCP